MGMPTIVWLSCSSSRASKEVAVIGHFILNVSQQCDRKLPICTNCSSSGSECFARAAPTRQSFDDATLTHATFQRYTLLGLSHPIKLVQ